MSAVNREPVTLRQPGIHVFVTHNLNENARLKKTLLGPFA